MKQLLNSKIAAVVALIVFIAYIIFTFRLRAEWWMFLDLFFGFMMVFSHLAALILQKFNPFVKRKLENCAMVFFILFIISLGLYGILQSFS